MARECRCLPVNTHKPADIVDEPSHIWIAWMASVTMQPAPATVTNDTENGSIRHA